MKFFGRERQLDDLKGLWGKRVSSLCTCRGRRRIGKSTLIEQFAKMSNARFIKVEGVRPKDGYTNDDELSAFAVQLSAQTGSERTTPENWLNAFIRLDKEIRDDEKTVVLIDETHIGDAEALLKIEEIEKNDQGGSRKTSSTTAHSTDDARLTWL